MHFSTQFFASEMEHRKEMPAAYYFLAFRFPGRFLFPFLDANHKRKIMKPGIDLRIVSSAHNYHNDPRDPSCKNPFRLKMELNVDLSVSDSLRADEMAHIRAFDGEDCLSLLPQIVFHR